MFCMGLHVLTYCSTTVVSPACALEASDSRLGLIELSRAPYVLYGFTHIDLFSCAHAPIAIIVLVLFCL